MNAASDTDELRAGPLPAWTTRMQALSGGAPGAAQAAALVGLIVSPPYQSTSAQPGWSWLWRALLRIADPGTVEPLRPLAGRYGTHINAATMGGWVDEHLVTLLAYVDTARGDARAEESSGHARLAEAIEALRADRPEPALAALRAVWRTTRATQISELLDALGERHPVIEPVADALTAATTAKALDAALLECLRMPPNPRVATVLAELHVRPRVAPADVTPTAYRLGAAALLHGDAALLAVLRSLGDNPPWLAGALQEHLTATAQPLDAAARADCAELAELLGLARRRSRAQAGRQLLDAVYAAPDDDAPRHEYAQWLTGQGDPRGEFIALQLAAAQRDLDPAERAREARLLKRHGRTWLGPLAPLAVADGTRFRRGFVSALEVYARAPELIRAVVGNGVWSTVESLEFEHRLTGCHPKVSAQDGIGHPGLRALRSVGGLRGRAVIEACTAHGDRLGEVAVFGPPDPKDPATARTMVETIAALPHVTRLRVGNGSGLMAGRHEPTLLDTLFAGPLASTVETFSTMGFIGNDELLRLVAYFRTHVLSLRTLELRTDACGSWTHTGLTFRLSYERGTLAPTLHARHAPRDGGSLSFLASYLNDFGSVGIEHAEVHVPPGVDGPRAFADAISGWLTPPRTMPELTFVNETRPASRRRSG